ncbi:MAG TPA: sodium:solute symporter family protein [Longimicrobiales bacterium]|nr:sodium:solute symporter family protein [Longimicrobiales bacterium]
MSALDWVVVGSYLVLSLAIGIYLSRRGSRSMAEFFVSGRSLPWWLAGTSMAATTFSIDTPLYVSGLVARQGVAGNWQWWAFGISHVMLVYVFARLWRRAEVITDAELIEIRYGGRPAAILRAFRAFLFAVPINVIAMGYAMLAARKVVVALGLGDVLPAALGDPDLWAVVIIVVLTLVYAGLAGLWGVVATDFLQFFLALFGAIVVAAVAVGDVGGLAALRDQLEARGLGNRLDFMPFGELAQLSVWTFFAYLGIQWWAFRRSDGGGEFIQRLSASKDEREAERATWFFNILNYVVRTWPWVIVGLVALVLYPDLLEQGADPEIGYPRLMMDYLPAGLLGLVVASLVAAFMSTVSTQINWGASYITSDLYRRFLRPDASQRELVCVGRFASVVLVALAGWVAFHAQDIGTIFTFIIAIGTGPGAVLILRWFWWRINAWAEIASMAAGLLIALFLYTPTVDWSTWGAIGRPMLAIAALARPVSQFGNAGVLAVTAFGTAAVWLTVMALTRPESDETLDAFYRRARPGGPGWRRQRERTGLEPLQDLSTDIRSTICGILVIFGSMFAVGGALFLRWGTALASAATAVAAGVLLRRLRRGAAPRSAT